MRRILTFAVTLLSVAVMLIESALTGKAAEPIEPNPQTTRSALIADLEFLTSDELRGRDAATESIDIASNYIAERYAAIGLKTAWFDGTPFQSVDIPVGSRPDKPEMNFASFELDAAEDITCSLNESFSPLAIGRDRGRITGSLAWVGYGIDAPDRNYNDYEGMDVRGRILLMLRKEPGVNNPDSPFDGRKNTRHAFFDTKIAKAIDRGAAAVLLINDPDSVRVAVEEVQTRINAEQARRTKLKATLATLPDQAVNAKQSLQDQLAQIDRILAGLFDEMTTTARGVLGTSQAGTRTRKGSRRRDAAGNAIPPGAAIPVASISRSAADQLLQHTSGQRLQDIEATIDATWQPASIELDSVTATVSVDMTAAVATSDNVVGVISGRGDLADETIVIGAHYDHVGMGGEGSLAPGTVAVHNGADDNASGTATMLAVASRMNRSLIDVRSHRRVVFIAFTGEERGLLGSKHYVDQPRFPISETVAMINMDMVGRLRDRELTVYGTGSATMFDDLLDETLAELSSDSNLPPLQLFRVASGYGPSDHASFYAAGVPVLFFFTGLHTDYHRPSDDFEKLNLDGMIRITDMVCQVSMSLATMKSRPVYAVTSDKITIRRQITVFLGVSLNQQPNGVLISNVVPNSPADTAGWLVGDQLITLDGRPIQRVKDVFDLLREKSPEQTLPATVRRAGQDVRVVAKLAKRES